VDAPPTPIWEKRKGEPARVREAFAIFLELGPTRSSREVADRVGVSHSTINRWAGQWDWRARAEAFDRSATASASKAFSGVAAEEVSKIDIWEIVRRLHTVNGLLAAELGKRIEKDEIKDLDTKDLIRALGETGSAVIRGMAAAIAANAGVDGGDTRSAWEKLSDGDLEQLEELQVKAGVRAG